METGAELDGAYCVKCNVTDPASVQAMAEATVAKYGRIDALVNNAGINMPRLLVDVAGEKPEYELNEASFGKMFAINCQGACAEEFRETDMFVIFGDNVPPGNQRLLLLD